VRGVGVVAVVPAQHGRGAVQRERKAERDHRARRHWRYRPPAGQPSLAAGAIRSTPLSATRPGPASPPIRTCPFTLSWLTTLAPALTRGSDRHGRSPRGLNLRTNPEAPSRVAAAGASPAGSSSGSVKTGALNGLNRH
jgi:hypothetical protein